MAVMPQRVRRLLEDRVREDNRDREAVVLILAYQHIRQQRQRRRRRFWVRPWVERRRIFGQYETLFQELERESRGDFHSYLRMDRETFAELLQRVEPRITKSERLVFNFLVLNVLYLVHLAEILSLYKILCLNINILLKVSKTNKTIRIISMEKW